MPILQLIHILVRVNQNNSLLEDMLLPMLMHTSAICICISFLAGEEENDIANCATDSYSGQIQPE